MRSLIDFIRNNIINESQIYNGGEELAKYICELIYENPDENFFIINGKELNFNNIFFKYILIYVNENLNETLVRAKYYDKKLNSKVKELLGDLFKWNKEEKIFNYIEISVETTNKNDREIDFSDLVHELKHAWDDYQEKLKDINRNLFTDIDIDEYNLSRNLYDSTNKFEIIIGYINYVTHKFETDAFSSQAMSKFKSNLNKYENIENALEWQFNNNDVFKRYILIRNWFNECKDSTKLTVSLCNTYRKYYKNNKLSNEDIINQLENKFNKYYKALTEDINKIFNEYGKKIAL